MTSSWRPAPWAATFTVAAVATTVLAQRLRARSPVVAGAAVAAGQAAAYANARRAIRQALAIGPQRRRFETNRARAYRDLEIDDASHTPFRVALDSLRRLDDAGVPPAAQAAVTRAREAMATIEAQLAETRSERTARQAEALRRWLGGFAPEAPSRAGDPLALYGEAPDGLSPLLADVVAQVGSVLDEVRLLHSRDIEWSTLLFTLWARAALVGLAPALGSAAPARRDAIWATAAGLALGSAGAAPSIADLAMDRGRNGVRARTLLLAAELPVSGLLAYFQPSWATVVFAGGSINWLQRPDFRWPRLAACVLALSGLQAAGLRRRGASATQAAREIALTLALIFYTGSSYGAVLPLSVSTTAEVVLRGRWRQQRAIRDAHRHLLAVADALRTAGAALSGVEELDAAAEQLEAKAEALERAPAVLSELVATVGARSGLAVDDATFETWSVLARERDEPVPVRLRTPIYEPSGLRDERVDAAKHAKALYELLFVILEEAALHGMSRVYVRAFVRDERLVLRVANEKRVPAREGARGSGGTRIERFARKLPVGELDLRGPVEPDFVNALSGDWFGVQVSCSATILSGFPDHADPG